MNIPPPVINADGAAACPSCGHELDITVSYVTTAGVSYDHAEVIDGVLRVTETYTKAIDDGGASSLTAACSKCGYQTAGELT